MYNVVNFRVTLWINVCTAKYSQSHVPSLLFFPLFPKQKRRRKVRTKDWASWTIIIGPSRLWTLPPTPGDLPPPLRALPGHPRAARAPHRPTRARPWASGGSWAEAPRRAGNPVDPSLVRKGQKESEGEWLSKEVDYSWGKKGVTSKNW